MLYILLREDIFAATNLCETAIWPIKNLIFVYQQSLEDFVEFIFIN